MKKFNIEEKEMFSLLTSRQVNEISDTAVHKTFKVGEIVYDQKEQAKNLFVLIDGEVTLKIPSKNDKSVENFTLEIEKIAGHGLVFGANWLFGINRYMTRAKVSKPSQILMIDVKKFLKIIQENHSEFIIMSYLAKVYFKRYITAMKEFEEFCMKNK